jgi:hypothetical protein
MKNPFRPGAGLPPPHLAGREKAMRVLRTAQASIDDGEGTNPIIVTGLRGMGKTVLLNHFREELQPDGWLVPAIERFAKNRGLGSLWPRLMRALEQIQPADLVKRAGPHWSLENLDWKIGGEIGTSGLKASAEIGGSAKRDPAPATDDLIDTLLGFAQKADELDIRVAFLLDEAHLAAPGDLAALAEVGQACAERDFPMLVVLAGLRPLHDRLIKSREFASRFPPLTADLLSERDAEDALRIPVESQGGSWDRQALDAAIAAAQGIPFHVQVIGKECVDGMDGDVISYRVTLDAVPRAQSSIAESMFRPLWRQASPAEQQYLIAMARATRTRDGVAVSDILDAIGKTSTDVAPLRQRLIDKALIHGTRYGKVDFSYPGFDAFVRDETG